MRVATLIFTTTLIVTSIISCKGNDKGSDKRSAEEDTSKTITAGSLAIVSGEILPGEGADPVTVSGANIAAEGRPEISSKTDAEGKFVIENVLPGTVSLYVASNDGTTLAIQSGEAIGPAAYGLKLPGILLKSGEVTDLGQQALKKTGGLSGKVGFYSNPNSLDLTGSDVFVPGTGFIAKTDAAGSFVLNGLPPGSYELRAQHSGFAVLDFTAEVAEGATTDIGELTLSLSTGPEGSIDVATDKTVTVDGIVTKLLLSRTVTLNLSYDSDAALMKVSDEPSFLNKVWEPVSSTKTKVFDSDGSKSFYVMYSDLNGLESSPFSVDFIIDTEAPVIDEVKILYGWAQSHNRDVFADLSYRDTGTGIAKILYATSANGTYIEAVRWSNLLTRIDARLADGNGPKNLFLKVVDYAGHVSAVNSDDINRGTHTLIAEESHLTPVTLYEKYGPYRLTNSGGGPTEFASHLVAEAGTTLFLEKEIVVRGYFSAKGTLAKPILISKYPEPTADGNCAGPAWKVAYIDLSQAPSGVGKNTVIEFATVKNIGELKLNGGRISNNTLRSYCNDTNGGILSKYGLDTLTVADNTFQKYETGLIVESGDRNTVFKNNNVNAYKGIIQNSPAVNSEVIGNTFSAAGSGSGFAFDVKNGTMILAENSTTGMNVLNYEGASSWAIEGLNATNCGTYARNGSAAGTLTIRNSTAACKKGIHVEANFDSPTIIDNSDLRVTDDVVSLGNDAATMNVTITNSELVCSKNGLGGPHPCDFFKLELDSSNHGNKGTLTMNNNNITCAGDGLFGDSDQCRGFYIQAVGAGTSNVTINLGNNHWRAKKPVLNMAANIVNTATGAIDNPADVLLYFTNSASATVNWTVTGDDDVDDPEK